MAITEVFSGATAHFFLSKMSNPHNREGKVEGFYQIKTPDGAVDTKYLFYSFPAGQGDKPSPDNSRDWPFEFNTVPPGDWNVGRLARLPSGRFVIESTEQVFFPDIIDPATATAAVPRFEVRGCDVLLDSVPESDPQMLPSHASGRGGMFHQKDSRRLWGAEHAHTFDDPLVGEAPYWGYYGDRLEAPVYSLAHGHDVTPELLGWMTENRGGPTERITGFAVRHVGGRLPSPNDAADVEACRDVLARLHALGVVYGPRLRRSSFIILEEERSDDGAIAEGGGGGNVPLQPRRRRRALMHDFREPIFTDDAQKMAAELARLPAALLVENLPLFVTRPYVPGSNPWKRDAEMAEGYPDTPEDAKERFSMYQAVSGDFVGPF